MKKKELLPIILLSLIITGLTWFYALDSVCGFIKNCNGGINPTRFHGFPFHFATTSLYSNSTFIFNSFLLDILFWVFICTISYLILKKTKILR